MESSPSLETVFQALNALYRNPDITGKERASVWLGELQKSVHAWQVADQLLQLNQDVESCYFAAQTMRTKIQYAFHELPAASHESLRDSLMNHCTKITEETPTVIVTQLCLAFADLALQMATWKDAPSHLLQKFGGNTHHWNFLVEVLTVLPEEINSRSLRLGANRRNEITEELVSAAPTAVQFLMAITESSPADSPLQAKVFRCLGSWFSVCAMPQEHIVGSKLLLTPFQVLSNKECPSQLHEAATDCICSALYASEDLQKNMMLAQTLMEGVLSLSDAYHMSVALEDIDKSVNFCRIFTEMAESFLEVIVSNPNQGFGDFSIVELLLTCIGHHQYEVADITFNFWYRLSELLYQRDSKQLTAMFQPYIQRLIIALCRHAQFDPDHTGTPDEGDEFVDFRTRVSELVKDVVFVVGSTAVFSQMFESLKSQSSDASWDASEASLFVMCAVAKNIVPDEEMIVPQVLQAVLSMPAEAHIAVRYTSTRLVGELSDWIEKHQDTIDPVLQFLLSGLQQKALASIAANALQNISAQCRHHMTNHFPGLLQIIQAIDSFSVSNEAAIGLLKGTSLILGKMPLDKVPEGMQQLCSMQVTALKKIVEQEGTKVAVGTESDPTVWLDRLAVIFRHTTPNVTNGQLHPCQVVILEIWPVLSSTFIKYQEDVRIIERCCRCVRFAVRCLGKDSSALLTPLVTQMVSLYTAHQHSCYLYLGSILVDEYGSTPGCVEGLIQMLHAFCTPTFKLLEEANGLRNHPDTIDDLFRLCLRFIQRSPVALLTSAMVKPIICCAIVGCSLDHKDANASVTKFLSEFAKSARLRHGETEQSEKCALASQLLQEHGAALTRALMHAALFSLPSYMIPDSAEILYEIMLFSKTSGGVWLEEALKSLPTHSIGGAVNATEQQLQEFHKSALDAQELKQVSRSLREFARLFR